MAKFFERLSPDQTQFIQRQKIFFVATAPPIADGRINLSPKGMDTFRVLSDDTVAYLDLTGSGNETAAHLKHDPQHRITIMFCSFEGDPKIMRLYGQGDVFSPADETWRDLIHRFPDLPGTRQIIRVKIKSGQTSCGFGVPEYDLRSERSMLEDWAKKKGEEGIRRYQMERNSRSIDGLETGITGHPPASAG